MLFDAILQRILHNDPRTLLTAAIVLCAAIGFASSLVVPLVVQLFDCLPGARARRRRDLNADLLRKYERACARIVEQNEYIDGICAENIRLVGLMREEQSHNRDWARRAGHELAGKAVGE